MTVKTSFFIIGMFVLGVQGVVLTHVLTSGLYDKKEAHQGRFYFPTLAHGTAHEQVFMKGGERKTGQSTGERTDDRRGRYNRR